LTTEYQKQRYRQSQTIRFSYSKTGEPLNTGDMPGAEKMSYTKEGWLEKTVYPSGKATGYTYDKAGRIIGEDLSGEEQITRKYDSYGRLSVLEGALGSETTAMTQKTGLSARIIPKAFP